VASGGVVGGGAVSPPGRLGERRGGRAAGSKCFFQI